MMSGPRLLQLEKALAQKRRPNTAKNKLIKKKKTLYYKLKVAQMVDLKYSHHNKKKWQLCEVMEILTNLIVVIILRHIHVSNHHIVHLKITQLYVNFISTELGKKINRWR